MPEASCRIVLAIGLPGSGKSTFFARVCANPISSDAVRRQLMDDESDQSRNGAVFATVRFLLEQRLRAHRPVTYIDATNLTRRERAPYIRIAREHGCAIEAVWFDVPLEICKLRNSVRGRVVPDFAMDQLAAKFVPPSLEEGFTRISREMPSLNTPPGVSRLTTR